MSRIEELIDEIAKHDESGWLESAKARKACRNVIRRYQNQMIDILTENDILKEKIKRLENEH